MSPDAAHAIAFLQQLRPRGPWTLTAIVPDGPTTTITARNADEASKFVADHNGLRNLYYSVNPLRATVSKKAKKTDVAAIEFLLGDLDPNDGETPEQAKERYLKALEGEPEASALIDSGNGVQGLWRLQTRIELPPLVDGNLSPEAEATIADVEGRAKALMERVGAKAGTQNVDRILRLPGTINLPNKKKREAGRVPCEAKLLRANGAVHALDAFPPPEEPAKAQRNTRKQKGAKQSAQPQPDGDTAQSDDDELWRTVKDGGAGRHGSSRSEAVWFVVNGMLRRGYAEHNIVTVLLDRGNGISEHIYDQAKPEDYAARQVAEAISKIDFATDQNGVPRQYLHRAAEVGRARDL